MELITITGTKFNVTEKMLYLIDKMKQEISLHGTIVEVLPYQHKNELLAKRVFDTLLFYYFQEYKIMKEYYGSYSQHKCCKYIISEKE